MRSVVVVAERPIEDLEELAVDLSSRTSVVLARLLLRARNNGCEPRLVGRGPREAIAHVGGTRGALVIGDPALEIEGRFPHVLDLGLAWWELTGLPFVFAAWCGRAGALSAADERLLDRARFSGLDRRDAARPSLGALRLPVVGAAVATVGVFAIAFVANRYLADFLPLLVLAALAGFHLLNASWRTWRPSRRRVVAVGLGALALFGLWVTVGLALVYQRELRPSAPISMREEFVSFQQRLAVDLFSGRLPEVTRAAALPRLGPPGALAIVGDCAALYQSDGNEWQAVERSESAGHFRLRVEFSYLFEGLHQGWINGTVVHVVPGRPYTLDAVFDSRVHQVSVHLGADGVLSAVLVRGTRPIAVGRNPLGGPVLARFPGRIDKLPVSTPTCSALLRRLDARRADQSDAAARAGSGTRSSTYW